ncbi:MAG: hypothetical protein KR126chlam5_00956 [Candidatus Anoxychlamydiales bacterium]|nr:hypothetical protein [Candidatus Anoxychlamydiales bacterium]
MVDINIAQRITNDPTLRKTLESAQTAEQKIQILESAGCSKLEITKVSGLIADFAGSVFQGNGPCGD